MEPVRREAALGERNQCGNKDNSSMETVRQEARLRKGSSEETGPIQRKEPVSKSRSIDRWKQRWRKPD
jgi:hypothetical protein